MVNLVFTSGFLEAYVAMSIPDGVSNTIKIDKHILTSKPFLTTNIKFLRITKRGKIKVYKFMFRKITGVAAIDALINESTTSN